MVRAIDKINCPPKFPVILKCYAKDMIRTQPYDMISWSAAYFRSISNEMEPPSKERLEVNDDTATKKLTKEYLKVLIKQVGKGYFVERRELHKFWRNLCLPQDDLLQFLAICRFLFLEKIPWLKLLSVMIGSLNKIFRSSIEMICELLTDDLEGGPNSMPIWMFTVCYEFLAELDCDGDKKFDIHENYTDRFDLTPQSISTENICEMILNAWKKIDVGSDSNNTRITSNLKFHNSYDTVKESSDFESLVNALRNIQQYKVETYDSSVDAELLDDNKKFVFDLMHEIGAPWSWMYQFVIHNNPIRSYNFVEENLSERHSNSSSSSSGFNTQSQDNDFRDFYEQFEKYLQSKQIVFNNISSIISVIEKKEMNSENEHLKTLKSILEQAKENKVAVETFPDLKQYIFKSERNHLKNNPTSINNQSTESVDSVAFSLRSMAGIGKPVSNDVMHKFIDYLKKRSINENGMIYPRHFNEPDCPQMN